MNCEIYRRGVLATRVFLVLMLFGFQPKLKADTGGEQSADGQQASKQHLVEKYEKLPISFEANIGQTNNQVEFLSRGPGYTLFLTRNAETVLMLNPPARKETPAHPRGTPAAKPRPESTTPAFIRMELLGANLYPEVEGLGQLPGKANYFIGNDPNKWRTNVPLFAKAKYRNVYPGVDLAYYGNGTQLEYDFIVAPGADANSIVMNFAGVRRIFLDARGSLVLKMRGGELRFGKPHMYQEIDGAQREISGGYTLQNGHEVSFQTAAYDRTKSLVIDPALTYSTYLGGGDIGYGIAADETGSAYVVGIASTVPTTPGSFQATSPSTRSPFVAKLTPDGSGLVYCTYLGGDVEDEAFGIAVDAQHNAYVTGYTRSINFPTTLGAFQPVNKSLGQGSNAFVTKLNSTGSALIYSTYLGGNSFDRGQAIALDAAGNAYLTGRTNSIDFPVTPGAAQLVYRGTNPPGTDNVFLSKLNAQGTVLLYSTYLGGSGDSNGDGDISYSVAVDAQDNAYVTGQTCSSDFPVTPLAFDILYQGYCNAFVTKISPAAPVASLVYSTYLGGAASAAGGGIVVDTQLNAYVTGQTCSANFPVTPNAFQTIYGGGCDAFVTKLNPSGSGLLYSTFLGGTRGDGTTAIALDAAGNVYVTGGTNSTDYPTTLDAFQNTKAGNAGTWNAFVTVLNASGSGPLVYSTYLGGGSSNDPYSFPNSVAEDIAVDASGNAYLTGYTYAIDFPTTAGAFQTAPGNGGFIWAFVTKFSGFPTPQ